MTMEGFKGKRPLGIPRRRWVDNIRMNLQEVGCGYMDWIGLAQDRDRWRTVVSAVMNLRVPWNVGNFLTSCKTVSCSRRTLHHGVSESVIQSFFVGKIGQILILFIKFPGQLSCLVYFKCAVIVCRVSLMIRPNVVYFLAGNSPASEFYIPTFRNTLSVPSS